MSVIDKTVDEADGAVQFGVKADGKRTAGDGSRGINHPMMRVANGA